MSIMRSINKCWRTKRTLRKQRKYQRTSEKEDFEIISQEIKGESEVKNLGLTDQQINDLTQDIIDQLREV